MRRIIKTRYIVVSAVTVEQITLEIGASLARLKVTIAIFLKIQSVRLLTSCLLPLKEYQRNINALVAYGLPIAVKRATVMRYTYAVGVGVQKNKMSNERKSYAMTKKDLSQLYHLNREIAELKKRIADMEDSLGVNGMRNMGMPHGSGISDPSGKIALKLVEYKQKLENVKNKRTIEFIRLTKYINSIEDSYTRRIFTYRFVDNLTWKQVAIRIGGNNTEDGVKKVVYRYLRRKEG